MRDAGDRILAGLKDAVAGNFALVIIDGQSWRRMPPWQPISSAPKDGSDVLLYLGPPATDAILIGHWSAGEKPSPEDDWYSSATGNWIDMPATHWQPLPDPPVQS